MYHQMCVILFFTNRQQSQQVESTGLLKSPNINPTTDPRTHKLQKDGTSIMEEFAQNYERDQVLGKLFHILLVFTRLQLAGLLTFPWNFSCCASCREFQRIFAIYYSMLESNYGLYRIL
jgi:hypothetical protein